MNKSLDRAAGLLPLSVALLLAVPANPAAAATLTSLGHAAGAQCAASDVNNSGVAVGTCKPGNTNGPLVAWVSSAGLQIPLPGLVAAKGCGAGGVTPGGVIVGRCSDANDVSFAVTWSTASPATAPLKLAPIPGLLGLLADVATSPGAYNDAGFIAGQSIGTNGSSTAVLWRPGSVTPVQVSGRGDNCEVVDVANTTGGGNPAVLLNCPNAAGTFTAKIATSALLGLYVAADLPKNGTSTYCVASEMNDASQIIGTCVIPVAPLRRAAFWSSPSATAQVLNLPNFSGDTVGKANQGVFINNLGHAIYRYQTDDGHQNDGYTDPVNNTFLAIPPLHAGATVTATSLGDNDLVVVIGQNSSENEQAAIFNPASPAVVTPVPHVGGGANSVLTAISTNGSYAVGTAEDVSHDANAVIATLP